MPPVIDETKCNLCGLCEDVCPLDILFLEGGKRHFVKYPLECTHCGVCVWECTRGALKLVFPPDLLSPQVSLETSQSSKGRTSPRKSR